MSDRSLPRWKRIFLCVSLLICLFTVNCSLFTVRARANSADSDTNVGVYSTGVPFSCVFDVFYDGSSYESLIPDVNVFIYDDQGMPSSYIGNGTSQNSLNYFRLDYAVDPTNVYDITLTMIQLSRISRLFVDSPVVVSSFDELTEKYGSAFVVGSTDPYVVRYQYVVMASILNSDGTVSLQRKTISRDVQFPSGRANVDLYNSAILDNNFFANNNYFVNNEGDRSVWIVTASLVFDGNSYIVPSGYYNIEALVAYPLPLSFYVYDQSGGFISIFTDPSVDVDFTDISWTSWLVNAVGAFMDFEIVPNFRLSGLLSLLIGMSLFMVFLKVFAGG